MLFLSILLFFLLWYKNYWCSCCLAPSQLCNQIGMIKTFYIWPSYFLLPESISKTMLSNVFHFLKTLLYSFRKIWLLFITGQRTTFRFLYWHVVYKWILFYKLYSTGFCNAYHYLPWTFYNSYFKLIFAFDTFHIISSMKEIELKGVGEKTESRGVQRKKEGLIKENNSKGEEKQ